LDYGIKRICFQCQEELVFLEHIRPGRRLSALIPNIKTAKTISAYAKEA
jgi:hypothetical protein